MELANYDLIESGGLLMWPLIFMGMLALIIFLERVLFLHRGQINTNEFLVGIRNLLDRDRLVEALTVCEETPGTIGNLVKTALLHIDEDEDHIRGAIQSAALVEIPLLERRIETLAAIARIAPLIGLLGTVLGMVKTYFLLNQSGSYARMDILSAGIAEALITTGTGLFISILTYLAYHFLSGRVRALVHDMEYAGHDIMLYIQRFWSQRKVLEQGPESHEEL